MVNYYIYAKDFSGSTDGNSYFHKLGLQTLTQFKDDVEKKEHELSAAGEPLTESKLIYLHWGHKCYEVDEETTRVAYEHLQSGHMGTEPATIIKWIHQNHNICDEKNKIQLLYIITDGLINTRDARQCTELNETMNYETVVFHAINENLSQIDLSVVVSFLKSRCIVYRNYELFHNVNIAEEFDYGRINVHNFATERENLKSYINLKFINTVKHDAQALKEIDKIKKLRDRLFEEVTAQTEKKVVNLNTMDRNEFINEFRNTDWYRNLNAPSHDVKVEIEKSISTLINYIISDSKSYSFDALKFETKFDKPINEESIIDVDFAPEQEIEFPDIIMADEKGIPVILLTVFNLLDKIIFHKTKASDAVSPASFNKFKSAMECPLFLMGDKDISESIGYFYTLNVYKQLLESSHKTEPRTRRPYHGGIVLVDSEEFDKYNDYILSATYFDFKKINYNIGLFYYVLWKNCESKEWMDRNVVEQFKKYVMRRISGTVCKVALSSLPLDPLENTSLLTALWYCVELSSCIFKDDPLNFMHERMRMYYGVAPYMIEILKHFNYDLDLKSIDKRRDLLRLVMILKKIATPQERLYYLVENIFKNVNGFLISEIEKPNNLNKLNCLKLNHKGMLSDSVMERTVHLSEYVHLMHYISADFSQPNNGVLRVEISKKTFRPHFIVDKGKSFYTELAAITKKVVIDHDNNKDEIKINYDKLDSLEFDKILSLYNLFINCVIDNEKYPTLQEYLEYILKKKKYHEGLITIFPPNAVNGAEYAYSRYKDIISGVDVKKFIKVTKNYVKRLERIKAEEQMHMTFKNDKEIEDFIVSEEERVNLKKKLIN